MNGVVDRGQPQDVDNQSGAREIDACIAQNELSKISVVNSEDRLGKKYDVEIIRYSHDGYTCNESQACHD